MGMPTKCLAVSFSKQMHIPPTGTLNIFDLFMSFKYINITGQRNPWLAQALQNCYLLGHFEPYILLVGGSENHLEMVKLCWMRAQLKSPFGFKIDSISDAGGLMLNRTPQYMAVRLEEVICQLIWQNTQFEASCTLENLLLCLQNVYQDMRIKPPSYTQIRDALSTLISVGAVYFSGHGYSLLTADKLAVAKWLENVPEAISLPDSEGLVESIAPDRAPLAEVEPCFEPTGPETSSLDAAVSCSEFHKSDQNLDKSMFPLNELSQTDSSQNRCMASQLHSICTLNIVDSSSSVFPKKSCLKSGTNHFYNSHPIIAPKPVDFPSSPSNLANRSSIYATGIYRPIPNGLESARHQPEPRSNRTSDLLFSPDPLIDRRPDPPPLFVRWIVDQIRRLRMHLRRTQGPSRARISTQHAADSTTTELAGLPEKVMQQYERTLCADRNQPRSLRQETKPKASHFGHLRRCFSLADDPPDVFVPQSDNIRSRALSNNVTVSVTPAQLSPSVHDHPGVINDSVRLSSNSAQWISYQDLTTTPSCLSLAARPTVCVINQPVHSDSRYLSNSSYSHLTPDVLRPCAHLTMRYCSVPHPVQNRPATRDSGFAESDCTHAAATAVSSSMDKCKVLMQQQRPVRMSQQLWWTAGANQVNHPISTPPAVSAGYDRHLRQLSFSQQRG